MTGESVDVEALRKVAEAATPGPWVHSVLGGHALCKATALDVLVGNPRNAEHAAAFDPPTVLALLDGLAAATARAEAAEAREAALRAGVEALAPACWVYRSTEVTCTDLVGGELPNGATWVEDMCCLPCRLRALLATGGAE